MAKIFKKVVRTYTAGEIIFVQGADADGIYSIQSGRVSVFKTVPGPKGAWEIELASLGPGSMFGEMAMMGQVKRDASVRAVEFTEALIITNEMFENQMIALPSWVMNFIKILINRMRTTNDRLAAAMQMLEAHGLKLPEDKPPFPGHGPAAPA